MKALCQLGGNTADLLYQLDSTTAPPSPSPSISNANQRQSKVEHLLCDDGTQRDDLIRLSQNDGCRPIAVEQKLQYHLEGAACLLKPCRVTSDHRSQ